jgi:phage baseplate assembly protein W
VPTAIRYRTGIDGSTGKVLIGWPHLLQSLQFIWTTRVGTRVMRLAFGSNLRGLLSEDLTPALALDIYNELVTAAHRWEPEYRIDELQFVSMSRDGALGLRHGGLYFPEGRLGNYDIAIPMRAMPERFGRGALAA